MYSDSTKLHSSRAMKIAMLKDQFDNGLVSQQDYQTRLARLMAAPSNEPTDRSARMSEQSVPPAKSA